MQTRNGTHGEAVRPVEQAAACGPATVAEIAREGIRTTRDIAATISAMISERFGGEADHADVTDLCRRNNAMLKALQAKQREQILRSIGLMPEEFDMAMDARPADGRAARLEAIRQAKAELEAEEQRLLQKAPCRP